MWINGLEIAAVLTLVEEYTRFASTEVKNKIACKPLYISPISRLVREPHNGMVVNTVCGHGLGYCCRVLEVREVIFDRSAN